MHSLSGGVSLVSQPVVGLSTLQDMDVDTMLTSPGPQTETAADIQNPPPIDEIALVERSFTERVVINCSDISSCDLQKRLLEESTNGDSNEDDEDVNQGMALPIVANPQQPLPESTLDARPPPDDHSCRAAVNVAADVPTPVVDEFYNAAEKPSILMPLSQRLSRASGRTARCERRERWRRRRRQSWSYKR